MSQCSPRLGTASDVRKSDSRRSRRCRIAIIVPQTRDEVFVQFCDSVIAKSIFQNSTKPQTHTIDLRAILPNHYRNKCIIESHQRCSANTLRCCASSRFCTLKALRSARSHWTCKRMQSCRYNTTPAARCHTVDIERREVQVTSGLVEDRRKMPQFPFLAGTNLNQPTVKTHSEFKEENSNKTRIFWGQVWSLLL